MIPSSLEGCSKKKRKKNRNSSSTTTASNDSSSSSFYLNHHELYNNSSSSSHLTFIPNNHNNITNIVNNNQLQLEQQLEEEEQLEEEYKKKKRKKQKNNQIITISLKNIPFEEWDKDLKQQKIRELVDACIDGDLNKVFYLFNEGINLSAKDQYDESGLYNAATEGHLDIVKFLIKNGAKIDDVNSGTALWIASYNGKFKIIKTLLKYGANKNIKCSPTIDNTTSEEIAIEQGFIEIANFIKNFNYQEYLRRRKNKLRFRNNLFLQNSQPNLFSKSFIDIKIIVTNYDYDNYDNIYNIDINDKDYNKDNIENDNLLLELNNNNNIFNNNNCKPYYYYYCSCCKIPHYLTILEYDHFLLYSLDYYSKFHQSPFLNNNNNNLKCNNTLQNNSLQKNTHDHSSQIFNNYYNNNLIITNWKEFETTTSIYSQNIEETILPSIQYNDEIDDNTENIDNILQQSQFPSNFFLSAILPIPSPSLITPNLICSSIPLHASSSFLTNNNNTRSTMMTENDECCVVDDDDVKNGESDAMMVVDSHHHSFVSCTPSSSTFSPGSSDTYSSFSSSS